MQIGYKTYQLNLKYPFTIARFTRKSTPLMLVNLKYEGFTGFGEASMVPYMGENKNTAIEFLSKLDLNEFSYPFNMEAIHAKTDALQTGNPAIKAAVDIALHDLKGKIENKPCYQFFGSQPDEMPLTTCTIGIDKPEIIVQKVKEALADGFKILKIKLGTAEDKLLIQTIREITDLPLYVDANQGWTEIYEGVEMTHWLKEQGVLLIEQPMAKNNIDGNAFITENSPIPIIADEAFQRLVDLPQLKGAYHGINIKLMKSTGMYEAYKMIKEARKANLKVMIGCMSETSIATLAGAALAPLCDFADLDGPFLTKNNPYKIPEFKSGKYILNNMPGLGLEGK